MTETLHICLVSRQLQPNVIPWLELKPDSALLLTSKEFKEEASQLQRIARDLGLKASIYPTIIPAANYTLLRDYFLELAIDLPASTHICINLTGGTKLMALAAADVLAGEGYQFIYTDTNDRQIEFLNLNNTPTATAPQPFTSSLDIRQLIACGMASISHTGTRDQLRRRQLLERASITEAFTRTAINNTKSISMLNGQIADQILSPDGRSLRQNKLQLKSMVEHALRDVLTEADAQDFIKYDADHATLHFRNSEQARWLHGIWLEEFVWLQMRAAGLAQYDTAVELQWHLAKHKARQLPANELDVIAAHDNRLCIVECKTARLEHAGKQDILHKLSRLSTQLAGPFGLALLTSLHAPGVAIADRARHSNVPIICGQQLLNLKQTFSDWMARR